MYILLQLLLRFRFFGVCGAPRSGNTRPSEIHYNVDFRCSAQHPPQSARLLGCVIVQALPILVFWTSDKRYEKHRLHEFEMFECAKATSLRLTARRQKVNGKCIPKREKHTRLSTISTIDQQPKLRVVDDPQQKRSQITCGFLVVSRNAMSTINHTIENRQY